MQYPQLTIENYESELRYTFAAIDNFDHFTDILDSTWSSLEEQIYITEMQRRYVNWISIAYSDTIE